MSTSWRDIESRAINSLKSMNKDLEGCEDATSDFGSCDEILSPVSSTNNTCSLTPDDVDNAASYYVNLYSWLKINRMHKYYSILANFDYDNLFKLSQEDLSNQGFTRGAITKYLGMIEKVRHDPSIFSNAAETRNKTLRNMQKSKDGQQHRHNGHSRFKVGTNGYKNGKFSQSQAKNIPYQQTTNHITDYPKWVSPSPYPFTAISSSNHSNLSVAIANPTQNNVTQPISLTMPSNNPSEYLNNGPPVYPGIQNLEPSLFSKIHQAQLINSSIAWNTHIDVNQKPTPVPAVFVDTLKVGSLQPPVWMLSTGVNISPLVQPMLSGVVLIPQPPDLHQNYVNSLMMRNAILSQQLFSKIVPYPTVTQPL